MTRRTISILHSFLELAKDTPMEAYGDLADAALVLLRTGPSSDLSHFPMLVRRELQKKGTLSFASLTLPSEDLAETESFRILLHKYWGKDVTLEERVDPALLGSGILQIGDDRYDGSLRSSLTTLGASLRSPVPA